jgi:hypothetical protein
MQALNKKHQATVNKAIYWLKQYNEANRQRDISDGSGNQKNYNAWDKKCIKTFDRYEDYTSELPKREVNQIEKSELY